MGEHVSNGPSLPGISSCRNLERLCHTQWPQSRFRIHSVQAVAGDPRRGGVPPRRRRELHRRHRRADLGRAAGGQPGIRRSAPSRGSLGAATFDSMRSVSSQNTASSAGPSRTGRERRTAARTPPPAPTSAPRRHGGATSPGTAGGSGPRTGGGPRPRGARAAPAPGRGTDPLRRRRGSRPATNGPPRTPTRAMNGGQNVIERSRSLTWISTVTPQAGSTDAPRCRPWRRGRSKHRTAARRA